MEKWSLKLLALIVLSVANWNHAHARILFQDDSFHEIESDAILIGSNDTGSTNTSIVFGNDLNPANNGEILWNITTDHFEFDSPVDITGGLSATGNIATTGSGTITSAALLTASDGFTMTSGALNMTSTSGALNLSGLSASSLSAGSNTLTITSSNFNTTATGVNGTAIGATTPSTAAFTTLSTSAGLTLGGGTTITKHISTAVANVISANIGAAGCDNYSTVTVTGAAPGDTVIATPEATAGGIETVSLMWNAYVSAADTVTIRACNPLSLLGVNTANTQTWRFDVWQH